jgi:hypothetical protein
MPTMRKDGFLEVGPACLPFDAELTLDDANDLRQAVVWEFFEHMPVKTLELTDSSDKTGCAKAFHNRTFESIEHGPGVFGGAVLRHIDEEAWRLRIMHTKLSRARHNNAQQRIETRMNVEVFDGQLAEAVKKVRVVRGVGELTAAAIEKQMEEDVEEGYVVMQRRAYERHLTQDDCAQAVEFLTRIVRRTASVG